MSTNIEIANPLIPGAVDTPLDARSRAATLADVENIALPYVGMTFYVVATQKWYRVKTLKAKTIGAATVANAVIDAYEEVPSGDMKKADYDADNDGVVDTAKAAQGIGGKTAAEVAAAVDSIDGLTPATPEADGLMSAADKARLDELESGGGAGITEAERARLLPDDAADGDLAVCREGVDRGNGANTRLLVQPLASDGAIADSAYGNAAPIPVTNTGVTVDENGWMVFDDDGGNPTGGVRLSFGAGVLPDDVLATDKEWQLDILFNADAWPENYYGGYYCLFGQGNTPRFDILLNSSGDMSIAGNPSLGSGWSFGADHLLTLESYYDGADWRFTAFRAGAVVSAGTWGQTNLRTGEIGVGSDMDYRYFFGRMGAVRLAAGATHRGQPFAPLALPWLPSAKAWQLLKASDAIVRNKADRFSFSGQLKPVSQSVAVSGTQTVVLDASLFSRWILTGSGTATLDLENWEDGDKGELVIDTGAVNPVIPAEWVTLGADITTTPGLYVLEIAQVGTTVFYAIRYPNSGGTVSSISDHISIVNGYWYLDGVSTGVAATGPKGDKGDTGNAGATGYVTTVISANQPQSPVDGTIWIQP